MNRDELRQEEENYRRYILRNRKRELREMVPVAFIVLTWCALLWTLIELIISVRTR